LTEKTKRKKRGGARDFLSREPVRKNSRSRGGKKKRKRKKKMPRRPIFTYSQLWKRKEGEKSKRGKDRGRGGGPLPFPGKKKGSQNDRGEKEERKELDTSFPSGGADEGEKREGRERSLILSYYIPYQEGGEGKKPGGKR